MSLVLGFGAAALLDTSEGSPVWTPAGNLASPLLAEAVGGGAGTAGGAILLAFIAAVAFATILAVVAGLTLDLGVVGGARPLRERRSRRGRPPRRTRCGWPGSRRSSSAGSRSCSRSSPSRSTSPSWWPWRSRWRRRPTCRRCSSTCSGSGSTPAEPTWAIYGGLIICVGLVFFSPGGVRVRDRAVPGIATGRGSRWTTRASSRSPPGSSSAGSGTVTSNEPAAVEALPRAGGPCAHRRRLREGRPALITLLAGHRSPVPREPRCGGNPGPTLQE